MIGEVDRTLVISTIVDKVTRQFFLVTVDRTLVISTIVDLTDNLYCAVGR